MPPKTPSKRPLTTAQANALLRRAHNAVAKEVEGAKLVKLEMKKANYRFIHKIDAVRSLAIDISVMPIESAGTGIIAQLVVGPPPKPK